MKPPLALPPTWPGRRGRNVAVGIDDSARGAAARLAGGLRTAPARLTNLQRWLERVPLRAAARRERELLLQRWGAWLREAPPKHDDWMREAETQL
jgi:hypothetical protein